MVGSTVIVCTLKWKQKKKTKCWMITHFSAVEAANSTQNNVRYIKFWFRG